MIKRYGEVPKSGVQYQHRPGVYAVLALGRSVLLTHQAEPVPEIQLPGGGVDPGEAPISALHREVFEETGYSISSPIKLGAYRRFTYMPEYDMWAEKLCHIYLAFPVRPHGPPREEGHVAVWMTPDTAIKSLYNDGDAAFLADLF